MLADRIKEGPVLCYVTLRHSGKPIIRLVTEYFDHRYYTDNGDVFPFARPVRLEDIEHYLERCHAG